MQKLNQWRSWIMLIVVAVVVTAGNRLSIFSASEDAEGLAKLLLNDGLGFIGIVVALSAAAVAGYITDKLFKKPAIRKYIMGSKYIEGHWLLVTVPSQHDDNESILLQPGIAYMSYEHVSQEFRVETTRLSKTVNVCVTQSEVAHVRTSGPKIRYLNYFKLSGEQYEHRYGFSSGDFSSGHSMAKFPHFFEADISVQNEGVTRRQFAIRIADKTVTENYKKYGEAWTSKFLEQYQIIEKSSSPKERQVALGRLLGTHELSGEEIEYAEKIMHQQEEVVMEKAS